MMKIFYMIVGVFIILCGTSFAEDSKIDCPMWSIWNNEQKTMYLVGYSDAIAMLGFGAAVGGKSPDEIQKIVAAMWPEGYNLGKLGDELDKLCPTTPFKKMRLNLAISGIAAKLQRSR